MNYLKDYREGEKFVGTYLCKQKQILKTKAGKTYYSLTLQDKTGTADGKIWELNNGIATYFKMRLNISPTSLFVKAHNPPGHIRPRR